MWMILAILSAVFAALASIFAKVGIDGVNSNLATAIRTMVALVITLILAFVFLHEKFSRKLGVGATLIAIGALFMVL